MDNGHLVKTNPNEPNLARLWRVYRHSVWRKFMKNPLEILIDFEYNQLWHKSLEQNHFLKTGFF